MSFVFTECPIKGLLEIRPEIFGDERGYFFESYSEKEFAAAGLSARFVQDNQSRSVRNVLRGLHFQTLHPQGKLVRVLEGRVYDVAVDLRRGSVSFGCYHGVTLDAERQNMFYIPPGFAHGFCVLSDVAVFSYKCTDFYHPEDEGGLMWNDPAIHIDWEKAAPGITESAVLSGKDRLHPAFDRGGSYFDGNGKWIG